MTKAYSNYNY